MFFFVYAHFVATIEEQNVERKHEEKQNQIPTKKFVFNSLSNVYRQNWARVADVAHASWLMGSWLMNGKEVQGYYMQF